MGKWKKFEIRIVSDDMSSREIEEVLSRIHIEGLKTKSNVEVGYEIDYELEYYKTFEFYDSSFDYFRLGSWVNWESDKYPYPYQVVGYKIPPETGESGSILIRLAYSDPNSTSVDYLGSWDYVYEVNVNQISKCYINDLKAKRCWIPSVGDKVILLKSAESRTNCIASTDAVGCIDKIYWDAYEADVTWWSKYRRKFSDENGYYDGQPRLSFSDFRPAYPDGVDRYKKGIVKRF